VEHNAIFQGTQQRRLAVPGFSYETDQAGLWLSEPGSEALFKDFRVLALPD
jgi:hypothetical protein